MPTLWHRQSVNETLELLEAPAYGLSSEEAADRLKQYGPNALPAARGHNLLYIFLSQFKSPLIYVLAIGAAIIYFLEEPIDAAIILAVIFLNAIIGTIQEGKAQNTLLALKKLTATTATVLRDGTDHIIDEQYVVPGDILIIREGERIPADARVIESQDLTVDESLLTGESLPVHKDVEPLPAKATNPAEQINMVFKGTHVTVGHGRAVVVATGTSTVIGHISQTIAGIDTEIPLTRDIRRLSQMIVVGVLIVSALIFGAGLLGGRPVAEMFSLVVALSVSVIPEGLPVVVTLVLAGGVWRMSRQHALVRKLQAVEALGQASIIAVDKTGTLTKNEMTVTRLVVGDESYEVSGNGYEPTGAIRQAKRTIEPTAHSDIQMMGRIAAACASANMMHDEREKIWRVTGDPTDAALVVLARKVGFNPEILRQDLPIITELPFSYKLKYHAVVQEFDTAPTLFVTGAPEVVLAASSHQWSATGQTTLSDAARQRLLDEFNRLSGQGLRVIAGAIRPYTSTKLTTRDVAGLTFVGFYAIKDPLRAEVPAAIAQAQRAGVQVVMITGDHRITATAIAREAGIIKSGQETVITGEDMDCWSPEQLQESIHAARVFARVTPDHKLKIIRAFQRAGHVIAMTGDGVNDVPSLVAADLGVSMGKIGTEVAKEAADIVLLDDNFGNIAAAVAEGRGIYHSIRKVLLFLFSTNISEVLVIVGALLLGLPLPLIAVQVIWLNLVTDGMLDVALSMEPQDQDLLQRPFKRSRYLLDGASVIRIIIMALPMMIGTLWVFGQYVDGDIVKAWTMSLTTLAMFQWFNVWNCRHETKSAFLMSPLRNPYLILATATIIALHLLAVYHPLMQQILRTTGLSLAEWLMIIPIAATVIIAEEVRKLAVNLYQVIHPVKEKIAS